MKKIRYWLETKRRERLLRRAADLEIKGLNGEAIQVYERVGVCGRKQDPDSLSVDIECLVRKARLFSHTGQSQLSTEATGQLIQLLTGVDDYYCRNRRAWAHFHLASELAHSGRFVEGMNEYDELISEFGFDDDPGIEEYVAAGLVSKGLDLADTGKPDEAIRCFNEVLKRFEATTEPNIQPHVGEALYRKATILAEQDDFESATFNYQLIVDSFATSEVPSLRSLAGRALFEIAELRAQQGEDGKALETYSDVVHWFAEIPDPEMRSVIGLAFGRIGAIHMSANEFGLAIDAFSAMATHLDGLEGEANQENMISSLYWQAESLVLEGRPDHALRKFEEIVQRYDAVGCAVGHDTVAASLFSQAMLLGSMGRTADELAAYESLRQRFEGNQKGEIAYFRVYAMVNSIVALHQMDRAEEARQLDRQLLAEYAGSDDPEIRSVLALAENNRNCGVLDRQERFQMESLATEEMVGSD